ncbi:MAG: 3-hydroxyacyl-ACP dehydratase FabZ family protein [Gemmataceae bacterium]
MRWIWIDRFTDFVSRQTATAVKCLSAAEEPFTEHFPGFPVFPAPLILEGLAQTGGILVGEANGFREKVILAKIPQARFHREAMPGEMLTYTATVVDLRPEGAIVQGTATSDGQLVAECEIFFAHLDQNRTAAIFGDHNFVFSGELKHLLDTIRVPSSPA